MNERIQRALDGELPREALGPAERVELEAYEEAADGALSGVRAEPAPDLRGPVMDRIAALPRHGRASRTPAWRKALAWVWTPRPMAVRPAWALAAAALAAVLLLPSVRDAGTPAVDPGPTAVAADPAAEPRVFVHFRLDAADARSVHLAGDFTDWQPRYTLNEAAPGVWTAVVPVSSGVHQYAFIVDGERWVADPLAPKVADGFGGTNSRLDVLTDPAGSAL